MIKYLVVVLLVLLIKTNSYSQLNLLKGNWEDNSDKNGLYIIDTLGNKNALRLSPIGCDEEFALRIKNDTLLFTSGLPQGNRHEINFKILSINDSVLKIKPIRDVEFYSSDSFVKKEMRVIRLQKTEHKFEQPIRFEKLRYRYGPVMVIGQENQLEIDSNGLIRYKEDKDETRTGPNSEKKYYIIPEYREGNLSKTDLAGFLRLIDSIQLPSLHFPHYCVMDGDWAEIIFNYNGRERIIHFALWEFDKDAPDVQKLLTYLDELPNAAYMKPTKKRVDILFDRKKKNE